MASVQIAAVGSSSKCSRLADSCEIDWRRFLDRPLFTSCSSGWESFLTGKTVLITGAGGSIGSSLAARLMETPARTLVLLDRSERSLGVLYQTHEKRNTTFPKVEFIEGDILCRQLLQQIFSTHRPDIVFHAAAVKHLPALESDPFTALENNLLGTIRLLHAADGAAVECFVNVSTDKAVNPTSILGVSKRLAELFLLACADPARRKLSLRLGNVLGSSGSVVPVFVQSLKRGLPLTVTDTHASRYFLAPEEAVAFLLAASQMQTTSLLLPEMGRPRQIVELAHFLLREIKHEASSDAITFVGLRDGEKCIEQLIYDYEYLQTAAAPHLHEICGNCIPDTGLFSDSLGELLELVSHRRKTGLIKLLFNLVPEFVPSPSLLRYLG